MFSRWLTSRRKVKAVRSLLSVAVNKPVAEVVTGGTSLLPLRVARRLMGPVPGVGVATAVGVAVATGVGVAVVGGVIVGTGVPVGLAVGEAVGLVVGVGEAAGVPVGDPVGVGVCAQAAVATSTVAKAAASRMRSFLKFHLLFKYAAARNPGLK
jgi:hypothetical protein